MKTLSIFLILGIFSMFMLPGVFAATEKLGLVQKDPSDWSTVDGATADLKLSSKIGLVRAEPLLGQVTYDYEKYGDKAKLHPIVKKIFFNKKIKKVINEVSVRLKDAEPYTQYTLIYYGNEENNDVWPFATCIASDKTNRKGSASFEGEFDWTKKEGQKFWVVKSSDVDCNNGKMIAWNPTEYLFETRTI